MSYRLKPSEPFDAAMRRIVHAQIGKRDKAPRGKLAAETWVHDTRKSLKRLRAALRLLRFGLGKKQWRRANDELRQIGRDLSAVRERDVLPRTIAAMRATAEPTVASALDRLASAFGPNTKAGVDVARLTDATTSLHKAAALLTELSPSGATKDIMTEGLVAAHRKGQRALAATLADPTDEAVHTLRKAIQIHWRQMQLLVKVWPDVMRVRIAAAKDAAHALGQHQDLAMLIHCAQEATPGRLVVADANTVVDTCRREQVALRACALPLAARLFAGDPQSFAAEIAALWHLAENEVDDRADDESADDER